MPLEIEAKMRLLDPAAVREAREALQRAGAVRVGEIFETNLFLDTPDQRLLFAGAGLRLRRNHHVQTGRDELVLTYKGPLQPGVLKSREEIEMTVDRFDETVLLLDRLGYARRLCFEKRRESWRLGGCKIELDEVPRLGQFIEIEGPDDATILELRKQLGLSDQPLERRGYAELVAAYLAEHHLPAGELKFPPTT